MPATAPGPRRSVQGHRGGGHELTSRSAMIEHLAGVAEFTATVQFGHDLREAPLPALVADDSLGIGAHQEEPPLAMPASVVGHAIGFGVDDMHQGLTQVQAMHMPHHRVEGVQRRWRRQPAAGAAAVEALGVGAACDTGAMAAPLDRRRPRPSSTHNPGCRCRSGRCDRPCCCDSGSAAPTSHG